MPVVVVTDSSARLPRAIADHYQIMVVPLHVALDGVDYRDGVDDIPGDLITKPGVTTSGANPHELTEAFGVAVEAGAGDGVVAVMMSRRLSGTWGAARLAAENFPGQVRVVDSRAVGLSLGFVAIAAAQAAGAGADRDRVYESAIRQSSTIESLICVHSLDNLRNSGRISAAGKLFGSALSIKPILALDDGMLTLRERQRTFSRAVAKMVDTAVDFADGRVVTLGIQHCQNPDAANDLAEQVRTRLRLVTSELTVDLGPILGTHVGPGALGVTVTTHLDPIVGADDIG
ncbi:DegV family protein [Gordonia sp. DT30]|uniref:DegV family protein n=1 Tax=unclassified Gordonia (in: high G+C Gram-positive bacteria) TaxID=2657482 RepID=UPI003CEE6E56